MPRPDEYPRWGSVDTVDPVTGNLNNIEPPEEKKNVGWNRQEQPARNWLNWLQNRAYRWLVYLDRARVTDGNGVGLFPRDGVAIRLTATVVGTPAQRLTAVGWKASGVAPQLQVIDSGTLTLGTGTTDGNQPISGATAANIRVVGESFPMDTE